MHGTDESVDVFSVIEATKVLPLALLRWCGREK